MIGLANSVRHIGLYLRGSSESDTVTERRPVHAYMRAIYMHMYLINVYMPSNIRSDVAIL